MHVACEFLASQLVSMPWLLARIIVKYMDIISGVLDQHITGNLVITDGSCLLVPQVKKGEEVVHTCRFVASYYAYSYVRGYMAS